MKLPGLLPKKLHVDKWGWGSTISKFGTLVASKKTENW